MLHLAGDLHCSRVSIGLHDRGRTRLLASTRIAGAEAPVRRQHPQHGLMPPLRFISLAEELGLINAIGLWGCSAPATTRPRGRKPAWAS